jgi:hypothetical protein
MSTPSSSRITKPRNNPTKKTSINQVQRTIASAFPIHQTETIGSSSNPSTSIDTNNITSTNISITNNDRTPPIIPPAILNQIKHFAKNMAAVKCHIQNLQDKITSLRHNLDNGEIPNELAFKFKKILNSENEQSLKEELIKLSINQMITTKTDKMTELTNIFDNRRYELESKLNPITSLCDINIDERELEDLLDTNIKNHLATFMIKQIKDKEKKADKQAKFAKQKELQNETAKINVREFQTLKAKINTLQNKIQQLNNQGKAKGQNNKSPPSRPQNPNQKKAQSREKPRSTGATKRKSGRKRDTSNAKRSAGPNGKQ